MKKIYTVLMLALSVLFTNAQVQNYAIGEVVPDFTITDLDGVEHSLYEYTSQGKYVLVDFFAYWCGPCATWAPTINEFYHKYGCNAGSIVVLGVEYEGTDAQTHEFEAWAGVDEDNPYPSASGVDGGGAEVHAEYSVAAFPTYIAISPDNILLDNDIWPLSGIETLEAAFPKQTLDEMECGVAVNENVAETDFGIAPNPADGLTSVNIALQNKASVITVITDALGREVMNKNFGSVNAGFNSLNLDVTELETGVYNVQCFVDGKGLNVQRLVVR
ncbi:MAG: redoxin domain-containing protein [Flavobacteriales bacterium]|nr:redoxin domain-containing protein [Flavobacteriales bacterium]